jgi:predicted flap endonuclease-1-like 5' DNA nuclease
MPPEVLPGRRAQKAKGDDMEPHDKPKPAPFDYSSLSASFAVLGKPAQRALIYNGIYSTSDLARWSRKDLAKLHGIGPSALPQLDSILSADGMAFKI